MNKMVLPILAAAVLLLAASGCVAPEDPVQYPVTGVWVSENYTNTAGMVYTKVYDTFYEDFTGVEKGYVADGSTTNWKFIWIKNGTNQYLVYYSPIEFIVSQNGQTAFANSGDNDIKNWQFGKTAGEAGTFVGAWETKTEYPFMDMMYYVHVESCADGTGTIVFTNEEGGKQTIDMFWSELGAGTYVVSVSHEMVFLMQSADEMRDNFGFTYRKI
ncbi:MAG: hypothetical protein Q4Q04_01610 [Methanocorpusculum sp.]|nr:hypothetical protein [Methanocorpusculum sp.]